MPKEVAELEKDRKNIVQGERFKLRNGLECFLHEFDVVTDIGARNGYYQMCILECCPEGCCHDMYISVMMLNSECPPFHLRMHLLFSRKRRAYFRG